MKQLSLKLKLLLISLSIGSGVIILNSSKIIAASTSSPTLSPELLVKNTRDRSKVQKISKQKNTIDYKNKELDKSSQQLLGGWTKTEIYESGDEEQFTVFFQPDGSWYFIRTKKNGDWYITARGNWQLSNGILQQTFEDGTSLEGSLKFLSNNNEYYYENDNSQGKWQKISGQKNLSANQLVGTWILLDQDRIGSSLITNHFKSSFVKLIKLNSDGTFRYKSTDLRFVIPGSEIETRRFSGTWEYINSGYADGFLFLRDSQGEVFSVSSVNWTSNKSFFNIHRSEYDKSKNQYFPGTIEKFEPSEQKVD